jgi:hypothetical protein
MLSDLWYQLLDRQPGFRGDLLDEVVAQDAVQRIGRNRWMA